MGCCNKFALFVINFIVFGIGVGVVVIASLVISKDGTYGALLKEGMFTLPIIVLIAGLVILLIGFLGCCGALKENSCMLQTYAAIVLILLIAEIILGILILVYTEQAEDIVKKSMKKIYEGYGGDDEALTKSLDSAMHDLHCCGVSNYTDWADLPFGETKGRVAYGCCKEMTTGCNEHVTDTHNTDRIYTQGCFEAVKEDVKGLAIGLGVICIVLALVQLMSISCACAIAKRSKHYA